jgi:uncharacterized protein YndB with AHSA1/START domain
MSSTGTATDTLTTQVYRIYIKTSPERVWEAITSPDWTEKYFYGTRLDVDLRPGGRYVATPGAPMLAGFEAMGMEPMPVVVDGEVVESDPPRKLVHTFQMLMDPDIAAEGHTRVTWELFPIADDVTKLIVTHDVTGAPLTAAMIHGVDGPDADGGGGWDQILSGLKTLLETGEVLHAD